MHFTLDSREIIRVIDTDPNQQIFEAQEKRWILVFTIAYKTLKQKKNVVFSILTVV